jgi:hypothetical protein
MMTSSDAIFCPGDDDDGEIHEHVFFPSYETLYFEFCVYKSR